MHHTNFFFNEMMSWMIENWMNISQHYDKWQHLKNYESTMPLFIFIVYFFKEWKILLDLHLVLVTLQGLFTISIEQDK